MLHDQAQTLRRLVQQSSASPDAQVGPSLVAVAGAKGGVGTTTIAVNLAAALALAGKRTVLVDADLRGGDAQELCGIRGLYSVADVFSRRRTIHEVLEAGPAGLQVVPGVWALGADADVSPEAQQRLIGQLRELGPHGDVVILDTGSGIDRATQTFWQSADLVLLVSTTEPVAIMDAYAGVKVHLAEHSDLPVDVVINRPDDDESATDAYQRLDGASGRFLGRRIGFAGSVRQFTASLSSQSTERPLVVGAPQSAFAAHITQLAQHTAARCDALHASRSIPMPAGQSGTPLPEAA